MLRTDAAERRAGDPTGIDPYRQLATRVIGQALRDFLGGGAERESARRFLLGSKMLGHWCELARVDARRIERRARLLDAGAVAVARRKTPC
jgi:hypothetical protein